MKNILIIIITFISLSINAQDKGFSIGLEAGPSYPNFRDFYDENEFKICLNVGITTKYFINKYFSINSGIRYERKGATYHRMFTNKFSEPIKEGSFSWKLDYLVVPLLIELNLGKKVNFLLSTGPFLGYLFNKYSTFNNEPIENIFLEYSNKFEFGITSNIGVLFKINKKLSIKIEGRNNWGISTITKYGPLKTNSFAIITGISYSFNKE